MPSRAPVFHTPTDTTAEAALARRVEQAWGWKLHRQPPHSPVDYFAANTIGELRALVELKCRKCSAADFPTLMLNASKALTLVHWSHVLELPAIVVASYRDGDRWLRLDDRDKLLARMGQRRGEPWKPIVYADRLKPL